MVSVALYAIGNTRLLFDCRNSRSSRSECIKSKCGAEEAQEALSLIHMRASKQIRSLSVFFFQNLHVHESTLNPAMARLVIPRGTNLVVFFISVIGLISFLKSSFRKPPIGVIMGIALAIVAVLLALFIQWLLIRRAHRREAFAGPGITLVAPQSRASIAKGLPPQNYPNDMPISTPTAAQPSERDAELGQYPPSSSAALLNAFSPDAPSQPPGPYPTLFSTTAEAEPGAGSSPPARQAYLAAEIRAAQALLERGGKDVEVRAAKAKIRVLEERRQSAWALGLE